MDVINICADSKSKLEYTVCKILNFTATSKFFIHQLQIHIYIIIIIIQIHTSSDSLSLPDYIHC